MAACQIFPVYFVHFYTYIIKSRTRVTGNNQKLHIPLWQVENKPQNPWDKVGKNIFKRPKNVREQRTLVAV